MDGHRNDEHEHDDHADHAGGEKETLLHRVRHLFAHGHRHDSVGALRDTSAPIVIECVDAKDKIEAVLLTVDEMIGDGLVTLERVEVRVYRANSR